jgi:hypothetical protein
VWSVVGVNEQRCDVKLVACDAGPAPILRDPVHPSIPCGYIPKSSHEHPCARPQTGGWIRVMGVSCSSSTSSQTRGTVCMEIEVSGANPSSPLKISNRMKKSLMDLVVIYYNLILLKISYDYGRWKWSVLVRIFYKNNSI